MSSVWRYAEVAAMMMGVVAFWATAAERQTVDPVSGDAKERTAAEWHELYLKSFRAKNAAWLMIARDPKAFAAFAAKEGDEVAYLKRCLVMVGNSGVRLVGVDFAKNAGRRRCVQDLADFMKDRGDAMLAKMVGREQLTLAEQKYEDLLLGVATWRATRGLKSGCRAFLDIFPPKPKAKFSKLDHATIRYIERLRSRAARAVRKGYLGQKLTPEDIAALRIPCMGGQLTNGGAQVHYLTDRKMMPYTYPSGKLLDMDFRFRRIEDVWASPLFSHEYPHNPLHALAPEVVLDALARFPHWAKANDAAGNAFTVPAPLPPVEQDGEAYVRLSQFRGKKAFVYFGADTADDCWTDIKWPAYEGLYQAYKDHVAFYMVNVTIGEAALSGNCYVGPKKDYSRIGTIGHEINGHPFSDEEHARTAAQQYMTHPQAAFPTLLDNLGNTFHYGLGKRMGGSACFHAITRDGRVLHSNAFPGQLGIGFGYHGQILNINASERLLHAVVAHDGRFDESQLPLAQGFWNLYRLEGKRKGSEFKGAGVVVSRVDADGVVHAAWPKDGKVGGFYHLLKSPPKEVQIVCDPETVVLEYKTARPVSAMQLKKGDVLGTLGWYDREQPTRIRAHTLYVVRRAGRPEGYLLSAIGYWLSARFVSADAEKRSILVQPILDTDKMIGYQMWKKLGAKAMPFGEALENLQRLEMDIARAKKGGTFTLGLNADADIFLNANFAKLGDLKKGDFLHIGYHPKELEEPNPSVVCVRASRPITPMSAIEEDGDGK
jgi:hypothetical protein